MINVNDKLLITKDINTVLVRYSIQVTYKNLLIKFIVSNNSEKYVELTELFKSVYEDYNSGVGFMHRDIQINLANFVKSYLSDLDGADLTGMHFYTLNKSYLRELENEELDDFLVDINKEFSDETFGRYLASKLYEPEKTKLNSQLVELLTDEIAQFSKEFDFSTGFEDSTFEEIEENVDRQLVFLKRIN